MKDKPKLTFVLLISLALIVIVESVYIIEQLTPSSILPGVIQRTVSPLKTPSGTMSLRLSEDQTVKVGAELDTQLMLTVEEPIASADVVLEFNPQLVSISRITGNKNLFEQILINQQKETEGIIKITAYLPKKTIKGEETLATISFQLLQNQPTEIKISYLGVDETIDSNLVSQATLTDILSQVENLELRP